MHLSRYLSGLKVTSKIKQGRVRFHDQDHVAQKTGETRWGDECLIAEWNNNPDIYIWGYINESGRRQ